MNLLYVVIAIFLLGFLVWVHELGHYTAARLTGVPVIEFAIGFGPKIPFLSKTSKKTGIKYAIHAVPFGGYVAFADTSDEHGIEKYYATSVWKRLFTSVSGPLMNFLLAFVVLIFYGMLIGIPKDIPAVGAIQPDSPAAAAGLMVGDRFVRISGVDIGDNVDLISQLIGESKGKTIDIVVQRNGAHVPLTLTPQFNDQDQRYMIGINIAQTYYHLHIGEAMKFSVLAMVDMVKQLLQFLGGLITHGQGADQMTGPVGIVSETVKTVQQYGIKFLLDIGIFLSVNLGLFNLLPIPALDGSKVIFQLIEWVRGKPVPPEKEGVVTAIGFGLLILLIIFLTGRDIARLFGWVKGP